jgi:tRNA pseudouridine55 synthase
LGADAQRSGFLLCDKPAGVTSHDVVARARREHGGIRTGHAGTLDPFATGLLVVLLGGATRLQRYVLGLPKSYLATARLGWRSSTGDPDGELTETGSIPERLELPTGEIEQRVPMTSAVRVGGERLYKRARRGEEVERPTRRVTVTRAELVEAGEGTATFAIDCSSGTYVRTLIEELGDAYCESLRRTAIGPHRIEEASPEVRPVEALLPFLPELEVGAEEARLLRNGIRIEAGAAGAPEAAGEPLRIVSGGELIAVARVAEGRLRTEVVLPF